MSSDQIVGALWTFAGLVWLGATYNWAKAGRSGMAFLSIGNAALDFDLAVMYVLP